MTDETKVPQWEKWLRELANDRGPNILPRQALAELDRLRALEAMLRHLADSFCCLWCGRQVGRPHLPDCELDRLLEAK